MWVYDRRVSGVCLWSGLIGQGGVTIGTWSNGSLGGMWVSAVDLCADAVCDCLGLLLLPVAFFWTLEASKVDCSSLDLRLLIPGISTPLDPSALALRLLESSGLSSVLSVEFPLFKFCINLRGRRYAGSVTTMGLSRCIGEGGSFGGSDQHITSSCSCPSDDWNICMWTGSSNFLNCSSPFPAEATTSLSCDCWCASWSMLSCWTSSVALLHFSLDTPPRIPRLGRRIPGSVTFIGQSRLTADWGDGIGPDQHTSSCSSAYSRVIFARLVEPTWSTCNPTEKGEFIMLETHIKLSKLYFYSNWTFSTRFCEPS